MSVFMLYPLIASIYYSFCDYSVLKKPMWVGFANYSDLMRDEVFWIATKNTFIYAIIALPLSSVVALALAMLLNAKTRGLPIYRTLFFLPSLVPVVPLAVLWFWLFNGQHGIMNEMLIAAHLPSVNWLSDPAYTKLAVVFMSVWGGGNAMLIYLAGLQDVPASLLEAGELDGASPIQKTWNITIPMISPVMLFNVIMGMIGALQVFAAPYVLWPTGSPERSAYFYSMYLYDNAFKFNKMGDACAMGCMMFLVMLALTAALLRFSSRNVHYQDGSS